MNRYLSSEILALSKGKLPTVITKRKTPKEKISFFIPLYPFVKACLTSGDE